MNFNKKRVLTAMLAAVQIICTVSASAAEKGVVQVFKPNKAGLEKNQKLWENRDFSTRHMEYLDRGLVACMTDTGVFVSWRWQGTESYRVRYNIYRDGVKINPVPLNVTNYTDTAGTADSKYSVEAVLDGEVRDKCEEVNVLAENKIEIPLEAPIALTPDGEPKLMDDGTGTPVTYRPAEASAADLDGDGQLEIVLKWDPSDRQDNAVSGITSPIYLDAYELDGTRLWRLNLGYNIRTGSHYTQFMVYDLDGDDRAELVCKTADGSSDSAGTVIGDKNKIWRNSSGYILDGPEYLTVFDAVTGTIIDTTDYIPSRGDVADWGDSYGNRVDRFLACVGYLGGGDENPSVIMCRGYYTRMALTAYDLVNKKLVKRWTFDTERQNPEYMGQGNHSIAVADVDMDGKDEILYGAAAIDDDGTGLYSTGLGHGDAQHTGDLIPSRPGLETFSVHEEGDADYGMEMRDSRTGEILWGSYENDDVGRGVSDDIDPRYEGCESWAANKMVSAAGEVIAVKPSIAQNFLMYWDGDLGREIEDGNHIDKWVPEENRTKVIFTSKEYGTNNGSKASPGISCDLFGDWREEVLWFNKDNSSMAIFMTTEPTDYKIYSLMHDLQYRTYIVTQNVGYNQPPHLGYYLGFDTKEIPVPRVRCTYNGGEIINPDLEAGMQYYSISDLMRDNELTMAVNKPYAMSNGRMMRIDEESLDVVPFITNSRTLVPLRFISESFGADVSWDDKTRGITIKHSNSTIKLTVDSAQYSINGKYQTLDTPAVIVSDRTFVPLRAVAEALGKNVSWSANGVIYITDLKTELSDNDAKTLYATIDSYIEPEEEEVSAIESDKLVDKQIPIFAVEASSDDGNIAQGAVDGSFETRWNGFGIGETLTVDFGEEVEVAAVAAAFYQKNQREYYFDIEVSTDGVTWEKVLRNQVSDPDLEAGKLQMFTFPKSIKARYLRYYGLGSSQNDGNNIWEFVSIAP